MDIFASGDSFGVGLMRHGWEYEWDKKTGELLVWSSTKDAAFVFVTTNRGVFVEAVDAAGKVLAEGGDGQHCTFAFGKEPIRLRYKKLAPVELTKKELGAKRKIVTRYLVSDKPYNLSLPSDVPGVIKWLEAKLGEIPKACRDKTSFKFDTTMEYGETYPEVEITYQEPESDEEVMLRLQIEAERTRLGLIEKKAQLKRLQAEVASTDAL